MLDQLGLTPTVSAGSIVGVGDEGLHRVAVEAIGSRMVVDHMTIGVVAALEAEGIDVVLLKGPAVARWLYDRPEERTYADADLLVSRADRAAARHVLGGLGFERITEVRSLLRDAPEPHAETWFREADHAAVDLHRCLHGTEHQPAALVWDVVTRDGEHLDLFDRRVRILAEPVRVLHAVLHLQPKDHPGTKAWDDLERAIARVDFEIWQLAIGIAGELDLLPDIGALLRLLPEGAALADRLGLPVDPSDRLIAAHRRHAPGFTRFWYRFRSGNLRHGARYLWRKALPPAEKLRQTYPVAGEGRLGLIRAHGQRMATLPAKLEHWYRYRRDGADRLR